MKWLFWITLVVFVWVGGCQSLALGPVDLLVELLGVGLITLANALLAWLIMSWLANWMQVQSPRLVKSWILFLLLLGIPHYYASYKLAPLKRQFRTIASGSGQVEAGEPGGINTLNFGGELDKIVFLRMRWLAQHQYLPAGSGKWWVTDGYSPNLAMLYFRLPLTKKWYDRMMVDAIGADYYKLLGESPPAETKAQPKKLR